MKRIKGFTLIELLVVVAIIALLLAIIMPALSTAKQMAGGVVCTNNQKQVLMAWVTYAGENESQLSSPASVSYVPGSRYDWVESSGSKTTYQEEINGVSSDPQDQGIRGGSLFSYFLDPKVVHCPSDKRYIKPAPRSPAKDGAYRTYSFVAHAGRPNGFSASELSAGVALNNDEVCKKISDIPTPGAKYVLVEENDSRGLNVNDWVMRHTLVSGYPGFVDSFGIYHNMRSILGFADAHAEKVVWNDKRTEEFSKAVFDGAIAGWSTPAQEINNQDLVWLLSHYAKKK